MKRGRFIASAAAAAATACVAPTTAAQRWPAHLVAYVSISSAEYAEASAILFRGRQWQRRGIVRASLGFRREGDA